MGDRIGLGFVSFLPVEARGESLRVTVRMGPGISGCWEHLEYRVALSVDKEDLGPLTVGVEVVLYKFGLDAPE